MEDLDSIAYNDIQQQQQQQMMTSSYWDFNSLSLFNSDLSSSPFMESTCTPPFLSSSHFDDDSESDYSSGYLQDALLEFTSKRRRLKFSLDRHSTLFHLPNSDYSLNYQDNYDYFNQIITNSDSLSGEEYISSEQEVSIFPESILSNCETFEASSSFNKAKVNHKSSSHKEIPTIAAGHIVEQKRKKISKTISKVVYPFALVKPGGAEGDVTLNDINQRILMPPTRPVRHPVGEFACRPIVSSSDGPGLSGKAVVNLTRIRTHGRGTITIIRTKN